MRKSTRGCVVMIVEKIVKDKLKRKAWSFSEITKVDTLILEIQEKVYDELDSKEKLDLIWDMSLDYEFTKSTLFGELFQAMVNDKLYELIAESIKKELETATVEFKVNKNEVSKRSLGGKPHKERSANEKTDSKKQE
tara:strand:+ start:95 stop:505 length:411 start_codon:yes stop_codon:yes gene_type:complete